MIPTTISSVEGYMGSFMAPLLEEARADLCSALEGIRHAPAAQVIRIEASKERPSSDYFHICFKAPRQAGCYASPKGEDVLVLTSRKPRHPADLDPFVIAVVPRDTCESKLERATASSEASEDKATSSEAPGDRATSSKGKAHPGSSRR